MKAPVSILELKSHNSRFSSRTIKPTPKGEWRNGAAYVTAIEADDEVRVVRVRRNRCGETQHVAMRPLVFPFESCESWEEDAPEVTVLPLEDVAVGQVEASDSSGNHRLICKHCGKPCADARGLSAHVRAKHPGATP